MPASLAATLEVNLSALRANYRLLERRHARGRIAAVVKANAYGLGVQEVSRTLWDEGCRHFFVATLEEGIELRSVLPQAYIGLFNGLMPGMEAECRAYRLMPVLNDVRQVEHFFADSRFHEQETAIIHIDTGMTRLGLNHSDLERIFSRIANPQSRILLLSHLACANDPQHPKNAEQLSRFRAARALLPNAEGSLCNSAGLFLAPDFHFDLGRPGCALYGINPHDGENPMQPVVTLSAPLIQIRTLERDETIGYGATYAASKGSRIAIAALGYADGWFRSLGNRAFAYVAGHKIPLAGRVSMDMVALDVTAVLETQLTGQVRAEFINAQQTVDAIAAASDTIGYEVLTRIGRRVKRIYTDPGQLYD